MKFNHFALMALAATTLAGCSTVYDGGHAFEEGWRKAEVLRIAKAADIARPQFSDCRDGVSAEMLASGQFAVLTFSRMGRSRVHVAPVPAGSQWHAGDLVYANVLNCTSALVSRNTSAAGSRN